MGWPSPQDYNEAIQNPGVAFADQQLQTGFVDTDMLGLPRPVTGAFASVYRLHCHDKDWAIRCFLSSLPDQQERYAAISKFISTDELSFTVPFEYVEQGIRVQGRWYPILKMEWVDGVTLDEFVRVNLRKPERLHWLADKFLTMAEDMSKAGIAHGDLQHGNVMISSADFVYLVDYDGLFVPELAGRQASELGHRDYQHPSRSIAHFGPKLDNFSAWVIYCSLKILANEPLALELLSEQESILFSAGDFLAPRTSILFRYLENHELPEVARHARMLRSALNRSCLDVPPLERLAAEAADDTRLKKLKPIGREDFIKLQAPVAYAVPRAQLSLALADPDSSAVKQLLAAHQVGGLPSPVAFDERYEYGIQYLHERLVSMPRSNPWVMKLKHLGAVLVLLLVCSPGILLIMLIQPYSHSILGTVLLLLVLLITGFAALVALLLASVVCVDENWLRIEDFRQHCSAIRKAIEADSSMDVQFYLIDRSNLGYPPMVRMKPKSKVVLRSEYATVRNWAHLTLAQSTALLVKKGIIDGKLYIDCNSGAPLVIVTPDNVPLWFR